MTTSRMPVIGQYIYVTWPVLKKSRICKVLSVLDDQHDLTGIPLLDVVDDTYHNIISTIDEHAAPYWEEIRRDENDKFIWFTGDSGLIDSIRKS